MKISKRDWAQLSAYLDGELSQRDSRKLENRIENNPDFQAALDGLSDVKEVLSHSPHLSVPRNFTLQPDLVRSTSRTAPSRGYRLAAAALSFLFVTVVVLDVGSMIFQGGLSAAQAPLAEEVMLEAAVDAQEEPEMMMVEGAEEDSIAGEPGSGEATQAPEMEEAPLASEAEAPVEEGDASGIDEPDAKVPAEDGERAVDEGEEADGEKTQSQNAEDEAFAPEEETLPPAGDLTRMDEPIRIPWLRVLEIILALGAITFGIAAWRRRRTP